MVLRATKAGVLPEGYVHKPRTMPTATAAKTGAPLKDEEEVKVEEKTPGEEDGEVREAGDAKNDAKEAKTESPGDRGKKRKR